MDNFDAFAYMDNDNYPLHLTELANLLNKSESIYYDRQFMNEILTPLYHIYKASGLTSNKKTEITLQYYTEQYNCNNSLNRKFIVNELNQLFNSKLHLVDVYVARTSAANDYITAYSNETNIDNNANALFLDVTNRLSVYNAEHYNECRKMLNLSPSDNSAAKKRGIRWYNDFKNHIQFIPSDKYSFLYPVAMKPLDPFPNGKIKWTIMIKYTCIVVA